MSSISDIPSPLTSSFLAALLSPEKAQDEDSLTASLAMLTLVGQRHGEEMSALLQESSELFWDRYTSVMLHSLVSPRVITQWLISVRYLCRREANKRTENPWMVQQLGDIGVCEVIAALLHSNIYNRNIVTELHWAIRNLATLIANTSRFAESGILADVFESLQVHYEDPLATEQICWAICNLISYNDYNKYFFRDQGICPLLIRFKPNPY